MLPAKKSSLAQGRTLLSIGQSNIKNVILGYSPLATTPISGSKLIKDPETSLPTGRQVRDDTLMRCFIAVNLPQEIKDVLDLAIKNLAKINRGAKINWTKRENLHLTLHFLDEIDEAQAELVAVELQKITAEYGKVNVFLGEIGVLPDVQNPRVIFIEIGGSQILEKMQKKVGFELKRFGLPVDMRPWKSHITIGRIKTGAAKINVPPPVGEFKAENVEFIKSTLTPSGPIYEVIKNFELR